MSEQTMMNRISAAPVSSKSTLYTASFFSGVRGLDIGAKKAGFTSVFQSDWWPIAGRAFELNKNNEQEHLRSEGVYASGDIAGNIRMLSFKKIQDHVAEQLGIKIEAGRLDVIHGGPPCQDYSKSNNHRKLRGEKNHLIFELLRIAQEAKPKVVLVEQVPDLLGLKCNYMWMKINLTLNAMTDYVWDYRVLNAKNYGARQDRKRAIIMMVRRDLGVLPSFPQGTGPDLSKVSVQSLLPHVYSFSPGQYGDEIKDAETKVFCTMTATGNEFFYGLDGVRRKPRMWERLVLTELEGLNLEGIPETHQKTLVGNMVQVSFAEALFRHIRYNILRTGVI